MRLFGFVHFVLTSCLPRVLQKFYNSIAPPPTTTEPQTTTSDYVYGECFEDEFRCSDDLCINKNLRCDGFPDCENDELDCGGL